MVVNLPSALVWIFNNLVKPLAPAKVQDKIQVAPAGAKAGEAYVKLGLRLDYVPASVGGQLQAWPPTPDARHKPP